jgi:outer membrane protein
MKKLLIASIISLCLPAAAQADALGLRIGANAWQQNFSGDAKSGFADDKIDIEDELGFDDDDGFQGYISFEHPIPIIPNILVQRTVIDTDANGNIDSKIFDGVPFNGPVQSTIDLTHTDATLYYEILDNWISLDIGLTARFFEEGFKITQTNVPDRSASLDVDEVIPMVYAAIKFDLPLTGLYVGADGNGIKYDDDTILDLKAMIGWESSIGLGIEAGYRYFDIQYEDNQEEADVTIEGPYAGLFFHF